MQFLQHPVKAIPFRPILTPIRRWVVWCQKRNSSCLKVTTTLLGFVQQLENHENREKPGSPYETSMT